MFKAMNLFGSIISHFKTLSDKITASNYEALQIQKRELDLFSESIKKNAQDFNAGQVEMIGLHERVKILEDQCCKSLEEAEIKGGQYRQLFQEVEDESNKLE